MRPLLRAAGLLAFSSVGFGYYHFVHFFTRNAPYSPVVEKFDVNALPNKTVSFFVAEQGPSQYAAGDSFSSVVSEIRLAAQKWADVDGSELELAFGGFFTPGTQHSSPVIEVVFDEVPPGVLAYTTVTPQNTVTNGPNGPFVPLRKSTVILPPNLASTPSWSESFFLTLTHEFGHALGLQHSMTSSVMSTSITRATKAPNAPDGATLVRARRHRPRAVDAAAATPRRLPRDRAVETLRAAATRQRNCSTHASNCSRRRAITCACSLSGRRPKVSP